MKDSTESDDRVSAVPGSVDPQADLLGQAQVHPEAQEPAPLSTVDAAHRLHELQVRQIELEMQNGELRHEQVLFLSLIKAIPDHIYFKDRQSHFVRINDTMAKKFGLRDPSGAIGKTDFDFFTGEHAQQAFDDEQRIMRTGEPLIGLEEKETWSDGHVTWASTTKVPLRDATGNITCVACDCTATAGASTATARGLRRCGRAWASCTTTATATHNIQFHRPVAGAQHTHEA